MSVVLLMTGNDLIPKLWSGRKIRLSCLGVSQTLLIVVWFGLVSGLVEGWMANLLRQVPGFAMRVSTEILWIAPAFNLVLFLSIGIAIGLPFWLWGKTPHVQLMIGLCSWVTLAGWLLCIGKLHQMASLVLSLGIAYQISRLARSHEQSILSFLRSTLGIVIVAVLLTGLIGTQRDGWHERTLRRQLPQASAGAPNLLLIVLDTLRADHLSVYGYHRSTSPNIDRLARSGVLFEHAIANASWTLPSHASMLTGRLPHEHKADWWEPLDERYPTLAKVLSTRGYLTTAFVANTFYVTPEWGLGRGFTHFEAYGSSLADDAIRTVYGKKLAVHLLPRLGYFDIPGRKRAAQVNQAFLHWLDNLSGRPFFAFLNYLEVHDPYLTVATYQAKFARETTRGDRINSLFQPQAFRRQSVLTAQEIQQEIEAYDGCLAFLDAELGKLFAELERRRLDKNTLVIVTADHGEAFGNHDLFGHGNSLYLEALHVPLLFVWPGRLPSGVRVPNIVGLHQIPSTVMELLDGVPSPAFPGKSLASLWAQDAHEASAEAVLSEITPGRFKGGPPGYPTAHGGQQSLVTGQWHFLLADSGRVELYAWRTDPQEGQNLAERPETQPVIRTFMQRIQALRGSRK